MSNKYRELKAKQEAELHAFPIKWAFSDKQFTEGMVALGLDPSETDKVCGIGAGGFIRKTDREALEGMSAKHANELREAMQNTEFAYDALDYELGNHEYCYTWDTEDALTALNLTDEEVCSNPVLYEALKRAKAAQKEWRELNA